MMAAGFIIMVCAIVPIAYAVSKLAQGKRARTGIPLAMAGFLLFGGIAVSPLASQKPLPPVPATGPLTQAESAAYTGPVTPGTYLRFLNWSGQLELGTVASRTGTQTTQSGTTTGTASGGFLFLGVAGKWVVDVEADVTDRQFAQLTDPQLPGVPAS
jgi:hypothetical protein